MLTYNEVLVLFSCLLSVVWRWEGCMSSLLTKRTLGINKHIYAYFHVPEPWLQFRRCTWHKKEEDYMVLVALSLSSAFVLLWWKGSALRGWNIYVRIFNLKVQAWVSNSPTSAARVSWKADVLVYSDWVGGTWRLVQTTNLLLCIFNGLNLNSWNCIILQEDLITYSCGYSFLSFY